LIAGGRWEFAFQMKFYPTEPATLHEDLTRYDAIARSLCLSSTKLSYFLTRTDQPHWAQTAVKLVAVLKVQV